MIPSQAIIIANYLTIADWGIRNTYAALILPNAAAAFAVDVYKRQVENLPDIKRRMKIMNNMPEVKIGIVAVSRDCFPESLSVNRRKALVDAYTKKYDAKDLSLIHI